MSIDLAFTISGGREFQMLLIQLEKKFNCQLLIVITPKTLKRDYYIFLGYIWISAVMFLAYICNQYDLLIVF